MLEALGQQLASVGAIAKAKHRLARVYVHRCLSGCG
jgi:hypothetical protein